jgi:hypothetical protein
MRIEFNYDPKEDTVGFSGEVASRVRYLHSFKDNCSK